MKILLTGKNGQVGWELQRTLSVTGNVVALDSSELNLADPAAIVRVIREVKPDLIVNPAAYTAVDKAESEPELAMAINGTAPGILAEEAARLGAALIHFSTDYVFNGEKRGAYAETDAGCPLNVYGRSKLAGEHAIAAAGCRHLILRTSGVYGTRGRNFMLTMLRLMREKQQVSVVADQRGTPSWSRWLAEAVTFMLASRHLQDLPSEDGIYHLTPAGDATWYELACAIKRAMVCPAEVLAIASSQYPSPVLRPQNSVLLGDKVEHEFGLHRPNWKYLLDLCLTDISAALVKG